MGQTERLYRLKRHLDAGRCLAPKALQDEFGVSPATVKRDIAHLRDRMNAPVAFDRELGGYRLERSAQLPGAQYELPGLWFSAEEIHALLTMQHLLAHLDAGGLLKHHIAPLAERLGNMLGSVLKLPYADPRELVMDILRHVPEVEVVGPKGLREVVEQKLRDALGNTRPPTQRARATD